MSKAIQDVWVEEYRPSKLDDIFLPPIIKKKMRSIIESGKMQHMLFYGKAGSGKTTLAVTLCKELEVSHIVINASKERNIDTIRTTVKNFASTGALNGKFKVIIFDEADGLTKQSQDALRNDMEKYAKNCRMILTCNFVNSVIEPIHSRCAKFNFNMDKSTTNKLCYDVFKAISKILKDNEIEQDDESLKEIIRASAPDWRAVINEVQRCIIDGKIDPDMIAQKSDDNFDDVINYMKNNNYRAVRQWCANNSNLEPSIIFKGIYKNLLDVVEEESHPELIVIIAKYQYYSKQVIDQEINFAAFFVEVIFAVKFK